MDAAPLPSKRLTCEEAVRRADACRRQGQTVVFTNGCFDLLHAGHVGYLQAARKAGDVLFIGLNSDTSVRTVKGSGRPLNCEDDRVAVLSALACVDGIILFNAPDPLDLIVAIKPDILVKGADWTEAEIIGAQEVKQRGGQVVRVALQPDVSTSILIRRILNRYGQENAFSPTKQ
jgi:rfaE bifunctional protein nucleotidyltransferase chain/domain